MSAERILTVAVVLYALALGPRVLWSATDKPIHPDPNKDILTIKYNQEAAIWNRVEYQWSGTENDGQKLNSLILFFRNRAFQYTLDVDNMSVDDVIPIDGTLYRLADIDNHAHTCHFARVTDEAFIKAADLHEAWMSVPVGRTAVVNETHGRVWLSPKSITTDPKNAKLLVARIDYRHTFPSPIKPGNSQLVKEILDLKEGDVALAEHYDLTVRHIMPPDKERHIAGWVEFEPKPRQDADAKPAAKP